MVFEEPIESLFTEGPARVLRVEERTERDVYTQRGVRYYGVVIYQAKRKAVPREVGGKWTYPDDAMETRFLKVRADSSGGCQEPPNAGRLLGHYRENGERWWVFLELLAPASSAESPGAAAPRKSDAGPPRASGTRAPAAAAPSKPSAPPASPRSASPGSTSERKGP